MADSVVAVGVGDIEPVLDNEAVEVNAPVAGAPIAYVTS